MAKECSDTLSGNVGSSVSNKEMLEARDVGSSVSNIETTTPPTETTIQSAPVIEEIAPTAEATATSLPE